ncbi:hypothetical protein B484DRAFT_405371, partial [Ochromonadaceae sp. CCMP2298]
MIPIAFKAGSPKDEDWAAADALNEKGNGLENSYGISLLLKPHQHHHHSPKGSDKSHASGSDKTHKTGSDKQRSQSDKSHNRRRSSVGEMSMSSLHDTFGGSAKSGKQKVKFGDNVVFEFERAEEEGGAPAVKGSKGGGALFPSASTMFSTYKPTAKREQQSSGYGGQHGYVGHTQHTPAHPTAHAQHAQGHAQGPQAQAQAQHSAPANAQAQGAQGQGAQGQGAQGQGQGMQGQNHQNPPAAAPTPAPAANPFGAPAPAANPFAAPAAANPFGGGGGGGAAANPFGAPAAANPFGAPAKSFGAPAANPFGGASMGGGGMSVGGGGMGGASGMGMGGSGGMGGYGGMGGMGMGGMGMGGASGMGGQPPPSPGMGTPKRYGYGENTKDLSTEWADNSSASDSNTSESKGGPSWELCFSRFVHLDDINSTLE